MPLGDEQICYVAAFIYGLRLIDEKARALGVLVIPNDPTEKCLPDIDYQALRDFVRVYGNRIARASL